MSSVVKHSGRALSLLFLVLAAGCAGASREPRPKLQTPWAEPDDRGGTGMAFDPCADRLHELCRPLLMHFALYRRMPATLDDLRRIAGPDPTIIFECPVSKQTYGYQPDGLSSLMTPGRIVMWDPTPAHDGKRWAVVLEETKPGQPLIPRVISIPEQEFPRVPMPSPPPQTQPTQPAE